MATIPARIARSLATLNGPPRLPLLGNALGLRPVETVHQTLEAWAQAYGPTYRYDLGPRVSVATSDPSLINEAFRRRPDTYRRISQFEAIFRELGIHGVFSAEGTAWRRDRRLVMSALDPGHLSAFFPTLRGVTQALHLRWQRAAAHGTVVDLKDDFQRFTVDVITTLALATPMNTLGGESSELFALLEPILPELARRTTAVVPLWRWVKGPRARRVDRCIQGLQGWLDGVIEQARATLQTTPANLLEAMLLARDDDGVPYDHQTVFGNAITMLGAGEDTTANTMAWAAHLLMDHPAALDWLREQVDAELTEPAWPQDQAQAARLDRIEAVANETMRLKPVSPMIFLEACHDTTLGDLPLPAGTSVTLLTRLPGLDPSTFEAPERFEPSRFEDPRTAKALQRTGVFTPFGSGPRLCPGRTLALLEMRMALSMLVRAFDLERIGPSSAVHEEFGFTMAPSQLQVRLRARRTSHHATDAA